MAGLAFRKPIEALTKANERFNVDTPEARYFPFYESHTIGISLNEVKQIENLDTFFHEDIKTTSYALKQDPMDSLNAVGVIPDIAYNPRFFPKDNLRYFGDKGIEVSTENVSMDPKMFQLNNDVLNTERLTGILAVMEEGARLFYKGIKKDLSKDQIITYPLSAAYWLWAMSPSIMGEVLQFNETTNTEPNEREVLTIHEFVQRMHPEDITVSLRNIFMARRLQVLGKSVSSEKGRKANIAFEVGKAHSGIERFLKLGEEITVKTLDIYPDWLIKNIIEYNGNEGDDLENKINTFCSVISVPVKETLEGFGKNKVAIDERMRDYLRKRFLQLPH